MSKKSIVLLACVAVFLAASAVVYVAHANSFCISEWRFIQERELIEAAVQREVNYNNSIEYAATKNTLSIDSRQRVPFGSAEEFLKQNPNCCQIALGEERRNHVSRYGKMDRFLGHFSVLVRVSYLATYVDESGVKEVGETVSYVPVSSCGKVIMEVYRREIDQ